MYTCPACGNNFFSEVEMTAGDTCPVCGEVPDDFIDSGMVESTENTDEEVEDDEAGCAHNKRVESGGRR